MTTLEELKKEALEKALVFHDKIEENESLFDRLIVVDEWLAFREVMIKMKMIRLSLREDVKGKENGPY
jgi:hypothetical protein